MARSSKGYGSSGSQGLLRNLETQGLRKGRTGSKYWFYLGTGLWTLRTVRRMAERREEILISEVLKPGQRLIIANDRATLEHPDAAPRPPKGRKARKAQRKADAKAAEAQAKSDKKAAKQEAKLQAKVDAQLAKQAKRAKPVDVPAGD